MTFAYKLVWVAAASLGLTACGGGDGGGGGGNSDLGSAVQLSAANYGAVAEEVVGSIGDVTVANELASSVFIGAEMKRAVSAPQFVQKHLSEALTRFGQAPQQFTGVVYNETLPCGTSGSLALQFNDLIGNDEPDVGDTISITANNCVEYGTVINGTLRIGITSISGNIDSYPFSVGLNVSTDDFRATEGGVTYASSGSFQMTVSEISFSSTVLDATANLTNTTTAAGVSQTIRMSNYSIRTESTQTQQTITVNGNINVPSLGSNTITVSTTTPFVIFNTSLYPSTGRALLRVANGGQVRVTANGTANGLVELDANSDGTYETSQSIPVF